MKNLKKKKIVYLLIISIFFLLFFINKYNQRKKNEFDKKLISEKNEASFYEFLKSINNQLSEIASIKQATQANSNSSNCIKTIFNFLFQNSAFLIDPNILNNSLKSKSRNENIIPSNFFNIEEKNMILFGIRNELLNEFYHVSSASNEAKEQKYN